MTHLFNGECLCGKIKYQYKGPIGQLLHCHCTKCRKWHGAAFRSRITADKASFTWLEGETLLGRYASSDRVTKTFCSHCGSNLISEYNNDKIGIPIGGLEEDFDLSDQAHIFIGYKAPWVEIPEGVCGFEEGFIS